MDGEVEGEVKFFCLIGGKRGERERGGGRYLPLDPPNCILPLVEGCIFSTTLINKNSILFSISINNK